MSTQATMKIIDAVWRPDVNHYKIECCCGHLFFVRSDRWMVRCPNCRQVEPVEKLREYVPQETPIEFTIE